MGKRGPQPTPTAVLKVRGSWRADTREGEPEAKGIPNCPDWISKEAKLVWEDITPKLINMGIVGDIDAGVITNYCIIYSEIKKLYKGRLKNRISLINQLSTQLNRLSRELGMTPTSRPGLNVKGEKKENKLSKYQKKI